MALDQQEQEWLASRLKKSRERHIEYAQPIVDGYFPIQIDTDIRLIPWGLTMHAGVYHLKSGESARDAAVYMLQINEQDIMQAAEVAIDSDHQEHVTIRASMDPIIVDDRPLKFVEALTFAAISDAENPQEAEEIFRVAFDIPKKVDDADGNGQDIPSIDTIKPHRHIVPNAKTSHVLTSPNLFCEGGAVLDVGRKAGQLSIDFELSFDDDAPEAITTLSQPIDREDVRVIAAVATLKNAGNNVISPMQIAENMGYQKPSKELQEHVHERVMKLRQIDGRIDWTEQAKKYGIPNPETGLPFTKAEITGHLLEAVVFHGVDEGGNTFVRYQLGADPITYQHAKQIRQVVDYPQRLLSETKPLDESGRYAKRMTREQTNVADSILWFVYSLKNPKNKLNQTITYERLFDLAGYVPSSTRARQRMVKFVSDYLRSLQAHGEVYGFTANTIGRQGKAHSVTVVANEPKARNVKKLGSA